MNFEQFLFSLYFNTIIKNTVECSLLMLEYFSGWYVVCLGVNLNISRVLIVK